MTIFSFFLGQKKQIIKALQNRAMVIDIRTPHEYDQGNFPGSMNIPVDRILSNVERIQGLNKPIIICGDDNGHIKKSVAVLKKDGIKNVYAGGNWQKVFKIMESM